MVHHDRYEIFLKLHADQLKLSGVPTHLWPVLCRKIVKQEFDAGNVFALMGIDYEVDVPGEYDPIWRLYIKVQEGVQCGDPEQIYLIDHAWTFKIENARKQLFEWEDLCERMATIIGVETQQAKEDLVEAVFEKMWKYCNYYQIQNAQNIEDRLPIWYILDEVGSAVVHSNEPNFRIVPFIYIPEQMTYSLLFPVKDLVEGENVTRDFAEGITDETQRDCFLVPWVYKSFENMDFRHSELSEEYFLSGHIRETLPDLSKLDLEVQKLKYKVFTEYDLIKENLKDDRYEFVESPEEADILWYTSHFKKFEELSETPGKYVNQFPFEYVLTIKDLLCAVCRRKSYAVSANLEMKPEWLPVTYNLSSTLGTELPKFISYFQNREKLGLDNHFIVKPFNLARGLDTHITSNLNYILRLVPTGPKIAQKYISNPVLFDRPECSGLVKFDIRYVLFLKSIKPLKIYVFKNFFLRFANRPFEMNNFDDYEKHFTVMNYTETATLKHMLCDEFKQKWSIQYHTYVWDNVEKSIFNMLREIMECAVMEEPPRGIAESPQSRALYAADIILEWSSNKEIQPKILEINFTPDCKRACQYYPNFYNDIFNLFFFDEENTDIFDAI